MRYDVLIYDEVSGPLGSRLAREAMLGGSEYALVQLAETLGARGWKVAMVGDCNAEKAGNVDYFPRVAGIPTSQTCVVSRGTRAPPTVAGRTVVFATDMPGGGDYDQHKSLPIVACSKWHASLFRDRGFQDVHVLHNMLGPIPEVPKKPGTFLFASGERKGRLETLGLWKQLQGRHVRLKDCKLVLSWPGWDSKPLKSEGIQVLVPKNLEEYRHQIAEAEGLFYVNVWPETYGNIVAMAIRAGTKPHVLCVNGFGGIQEAAVGCPFITDDPEKFEQELIGNLGKLWEPMEAEDCSPEALVSRWEELLGLVESDDDIPSVIPIMRVNGREVTGTRFIRPDDLAPLQEVFDGEYDHPSFDFPSPRVLDIGGNVGAFSQWAAARWPGAKITAYEPAPEHVALFRKNCPNVELVEAAVTTQEHPLLYVGIGNSGMHSIFHTPGLSSSRGDHVVAVHPSSLPPADILKVDTEGAEVEILTNYSHLSKVSIVVFEYHRAEDPAKIATVLEAAGLKLIEHVVHGWSGGRSGIQKWRRGVVPTRIKPRVCLTMMVKNEAKTLPRCLQSVRSLIDSYCIVVDSETTDDTEAVIARELAGLPGIMPRRPFVNYGASRTEALRLAEAEKLGDYHLIIDADDVLEVPPGFRWPDLTLADAWNFVLDEGGYGSALRGQMCRADGSFRYEGVVHEFLVGSQRVMTMPGVVYKRVGGSGAQPEGKEKYLRHAEMLEKSGADDPRSIFYLARSYHDAGELDKAEYWYERRTQMVGGFDFEVFWSFLQLASLEDSDDLFIKAYESRPSRIEPLLSLASRAKRSGSLAKAFLYTSTAITLPLPAGDLWVRADLYQWGALYEHMLISHELKRYEQAYAAAMKILDRVPPDLRNKVLDMISIHGFYVGKFQEALEAGVELLRVAGPDARVVQNCRNCLERLA